MGDSPLALQKLASSEHSAWLDLFVELRRMTSATNEDLNDPSWHPFFRSVERWGERLATLRCEQDVALRSRAQGDREAAYLEATKGRP